MDDLVSNVCGAALSLLIYRAVERIRVKERQAEKWMSVVLIAACLIECIIVAVPSISR